MMPNPYFLLITGGIFPVNVNVYTNGTVIVNTFTVTGTIPLYCQCLHKRVRLLKRVPSAVVVKVYTNESAYT